MELAKLTVDHHIENIQKALGVPHNVIISSREKIIFTTISNALFVEEMYSSSTEAPKSLTTVTGDLQKCMTMMDNELEYEIMLLMFMHYHDAAIAAIRHYNTFETEEDPELKKKYELFKKLMEVKKLISDDEEDKEEEDPFELNKFNMIERVKFVKSSNYNFEKYMESVTKMFREEQLKHALKNDEE
jgi:hypothetical protein